MNGTTTARRPDQRAVPDATRHRNAGPVWRAGDRRVPVARETTAARPIACLAEHVPAALLPPWAAAPAAAGGAASSTPSGRAVALSRRAPRHRFVSSTPARQTDPALAAASPPDGSPPTGHEARGSGRHRRPAGAVRLRWAPLWRDLSSLALVMLWFVVLVRGLAAQAVLIAAASAAPPCRWPAGPRWSVPTTGCSCTARAVDRPAPGDDGGAVTAAA